MENLAVCSVTDKTHPPLFAIYHIHQVRQTLKLRSNNSHRVQQKAFVKISVAKVKLRVEHVTAAAVTRRQEKTCANHAKKPHLSRIGQKRTGNLDKNQGSNSSPSYEAEKIASHS